MEEFCHLFRLLDASTSTEAKVQALLEFFRHAPAAEAAWALHALLGLQKRRLITGRRLREIGQEVAPWPAWLFDACYRQVGDSAETISLLWPAPGTSPSDSAGVSAGDSARDSAGVAAASEAARSLADRAEGSLADWMERRLPALARLQGEDQAEAVRACWRGLSREQLLVVNKLLTGGLRVGVSQGLVVRALARLSGLEEATVKHRLMGGFVPASGAWEALLAPEDTGSVPASRPYPFFLASPLEPTKLLDTSPHHWQVEWKYDGIRCQLIHRQGEVFLWSRGEDLINASFPELTAAASALPQGLVLDGEVVIWGPEDTTPRPFAALQRRLGRLTPGKRQLQQLPACFVIYDLLELGSEDLRERPLQERRQRLEDLHHGGLPAPLRLAPLLPLEEWPALEALRAQARQEGAEGVMLKRRASPYLSGRRRGHWWKHKLEPFRLDAVLVYAQAGSGRRANLLTDYTFALWDRPWEEGEAAEPQGDTAGHRPPPRLVTFAKAYSGLDDQEILRLDQWIRRHTLQRFGPVRAVAPDLVFELAFEGLQPSTRHRSGLAARFPRISRWRTDKGARDADSLVQALALMTPPAPAGPDR
ncbi:MAG: ATP-dependent DNA ligase [Cyanobacteria bacterium K_Offshore_surface_m2_239]|nr:ATP-dependent DNA ligase [Cyanobacteria bacterium K_Offshore_surface_m2_239]